MNSAPNSVLFHFDILGFVNKKRFTVKDPLPHKKDLVYKAYILSEQPFSVEYIKLCGLYKTNNNLQNI